MATDQSNLLVQQILLFQVSLGYFSIFDMGVPSHLKSQAYNGGSNNFSVWLGWLIALILIFSVLVYAVSATVFENNGTAAVVAAVIGAIFIKFAVGYFQSKYYFGASYLIQIWIPFLLVIYLLTFDVLSVVRFYTFVLVLCAVLIAAFIIVTRPHFRRMSSTWYQDLRGAIVFFGTQALTVCVFGFHEYIFLLSGESFLGWSIESRYYLFISAFGPVISNLFWAYLVNATAIQSLKVLVSAITALVVWGCFVLTFRDAFFDVFWPEYKSLITDSEALYIWAFHISHTVVLFVAGYLYAIRKERTVFWALCVLLVVRLATLKADILGIEPLQIYESNGILGVVGFVIFTCIYIHHFIKKNEKVTVI